MLERMVEVTSPVPQPLSWITASGGKGDRRWVRMWDVTS